MPDDVQAMPPPPAPHLPPEVAELAGFFPTVELFHDFSPHDCTRLALLGKRCTLADGETLFREGDEGTELYIVYRGQIAITREVDAGTDTVLVRFDAGSFFGEMALIENAPRSANAVAAGDTEVIGFAQDTIDSMLQEDMDLLNKLLWALLRVLCVRIRETNEQLRAAIRWGMGADGDGQGGGS